MPSESYSRVFQGRVRSAAIPATISGSPDATPIPDWKSALWSTHEAFTAAASYYLLAIAATAGKNHPRLAGLISQMESCWGPFRSKSRCFHGMRASVADWIGIDAFSSSLDDAMAKILEGNTASSEARSLAVSLLLEKAQGDSGIQQNGRGYAPRFINPSARPTWDFSASTREAAGAGKDLALQIRTSLTATEREALAAKVELSWIVKVDPDKAPRTGIEARHRLSEAVAFFVEAKKVSKTAPTRHGKWLSEYSDAAACLEVCRTTIASLPDNIVIPVNRKAAPERTFATLLFKFCTSEFTQQLLCAVLGEPKTPKIKKGATDAEDFGRLGDDPIKLARGERGYVFRAFTSLPRWGGNDAGDIRFSEFDVAAFKQALVVLNMFRMKTEERVEKRQKLENLRDYMLGKAKSFKQDENTERPPARLVDADPRVSLMKLFESDKDIIPPEWFETDPNAVYRFSERARRGLNEIIEKWNEKVSPGELWSDSKFFELEAILNHHQKVNARSMGSGGLFLRLINRGKTGDGSDYWSLWRTPTKEETAARNAGDWSENIIEDWGRFQDCVSDIKELEAPIKFTPPDLIYSRRQLMLSDMTGRSAAKHSKNGAAVVVSLVVRNANDVWQEQRVQLNYGAPRLARDHIAAEGTVADGRWLPPMLMPLVEANEAPPQDFADCAVSLMPSLDPELLKTLPPGHEPSAEHHRFLLNFPLSIEVSELPGRSERISMWKGQFNGADGEYSYLHWPATMDQKYHSSAWWHRRDEIRWIAVDLGQRFAGACVAFEAKANDPALDQQAVSWHLGDTPGKSWTAKRSACRILRLQGEGCDVWNGKERKFEKEPFGEKGRLASDADTAEANAILTALRQIEELPLPSDDWGKYFPGQNDHLLKALRRTQSRMARLQGWLCDLKKAEGETLVKLLKDIATPPPGAKQGKVSSFFEDLRQACSDPTGQHARDYLIAEINRLHDPLHGLSAQLVRIANRVIPLRDRSWQWVTLGNDDLGRPNHLLCQTVPGASTKRLVRGQRGLSMPRLEQIENLRMRVQSLNQSLKRKVGQPLRFLKRTEREKLQLRDPCPDLLVKLDHLKEQRVNQTAHLILAEALGVKLRGTQFSEEERLRRNIHGEYEKVRESADFIVIENLSAYRTSQGQGPGENSKLMRWCQRQITDKLKQLCEVLGITVVEAAPAYSSLFCARSGVPGFRANKMKFSQKDAYSWKQAVERVTSGGTNVSDDDIQRKQLIDMLSKAIAENPMLAEKEFYYPAIGGTDFIPICGECNATNADINAAMNLALSAVASPDNVRILRRLRATLDKSGQIIPRIENNREKAIFGKGKVESLIPYPEAPFAKLGAKYITLFYDENGLVGSKGDKNSEGTHRATHPATGDSKFTDWNAIKAYVKKNAWNRCHKLNDSLLGVEDNIAI